MYFFGRKTVTHLGFEYAGGGVTPTEEKSQAIAAPLTNLTGSKVTFTWQDKHQKALIINNF